MTAAGQTEWLSPTLTYWMVGIAAAIFVWWFITNWLKIPRRWEHDLPLLTDRAQRCGGIHDFRAQPGTDTEQCAGCGTCRSRAVHPHCRTWGHRYAAHQTVYLCGVCGDRVPRDTIDDLDAS